MAWKHKKVKNRVRYATSIGKHEILYIDVSTMDHYKVPFIKQYPWITGHRYAIEISLVLSRKDCHLMSSPQAVLGHSLHVYL